MMRLVNSLIISMAFVLMLLGYSEPLSATGTPTPPIKPIHEAFVPKFTDITKNVVVAKQPPQQNVETPPAKPSQDVIWVPGYWTWLEAKNEYVWVCGVWRRPPPSNPYWIPGQWVNDNGGWVWARGFWSAQPLEQLGFIQKAPPQAVADKVPSAPGSEYFWVPGYWSYSQATAAYTWLSGKWHPFNQNWILSPASYVWRPSGYVFVPSYWDWTLEERGKAYACDGQTYQVMQPEQIVRELYYYYPDYISFYWYHWHFFPGWWGDCGCIPPWWFWGEWWTFGWGDMWGLWWWWGHPGFFPPFWLSFEIILEIAAPPVVLVDAFAMIHKPDFVEKLGDKPLLPKGTPDGKPLPRPEIPSDVTPGGSVTVPDFPMIPPLAQPTPPNEVEVPPAPAPQEPMDETPIIQTPIPQPDYSYPDQYDQPPQRGYPDGGYRVPRVIIPINEGFDYPDRWPDRDNRGHDHDRYDDNRRGGGGGKTDKNPGPSTRTPPQTGHGKYDNNQRGKKGN